MYIYNYIYVAFGSRTVSLMPAKVILCWSRKPAATAKLAFAQSYSETSVCSKAVKRQRLQGQLAKLLKPSNA